MEIKTNFSLNDDVYVIESGDDGEYIRRCLVKRIDITAVLDEPKEYDPDCGDEPDKRVEVQYFTLEGNKYELIARQGVDDIFRSERDARESLAQSFMRTIRLQDDVYDEEDDED